MADNGDDIDHSTLEKMLEKPIQTHAQRITSDILKDIAPKDMDKVKEYIKKLNLKNLIITRLKNFDHYTSLTEDFMMNKSLIEKTNRQNINYLLKA